MGPLEKKKKPLPLKFISHDSLLFITCNYFYINRHFLIHHYWGLRIVLITTNCHIWDFKKNFYVLAIHIRSWEFSMFNFSWKVFLNVPSKINSSGVFFVCFGVGFWCCSVVFPLDLASQGNKAFYSVNILFAKVLIAVIKYPTWRTISSCSQRFGEFWSNSKLALKPDYF